MIELDDLLPQLSDQLFDGVYLVDRERRVVLWNKGAERIAGLSRSEVLGKKCSESGLCHVDEDGTSLCGRGCVLMRAISEGTTVERVLFLQHSRGHRVPVLARTTPLRRGSGEVVGALAVFSDDSRALELLARARTAERLAQVDALTGLANRRAVDRRWEELAAGLAYGNAFGVILLDIDHFKRFNDQHGHATGDEVLKTIAATLVQNLRQVDLAGRWGGEEFIVLVPDADERLVVRVANRLRTMIARTRVTGPSGALVVTASFGVTLVSPSDTRESAMTRVDALLYRSKRAGRHRISHDVAGAEDTISPTHSGCWRARRARSRDSEQPAARRRPHG